MRLELAWNQSLRLSTPRLCRQTSGDIREQAGPYDVPELRASSQPDAAHLPSLLSLAQIDRHRVANGLRA